jgi:Predicted transcriptional regulators
MLDLMRAAGRLGDPHEELGVGGTHWVERFSPSKLREARKRRGLTQVQLAVLLGQVQAGYSRYETGNQKPSALTLLKFAKALQVDVDELLEPGPVDMALLRARRGLSQQDVADHLGISRGWYRRIEFREIPIARGLVPRLSKLLKVDGDQLADLLIIRPAE